MGWGDTTVDEVLGDVLGRPNEDSVHRLRGALEDRLFGTARHASTEPPALSRYIVGGQLGQGGLGIVFAGFDPELDRPVAIKLLRPRTKASELDPGRIRREAQALARIQDPRVVSVFDVGWCDVAAMARSGLPAEFTTRPAIFIVMELVQGETLAAWFSRSRTWADTVRTLIEAGRGLAAAHAEGVIHRDFKPTNVMVSAGGSVRVLDFGLARVCQGPAAPHVEAWTDEEADTSRTGSGAFVGTPAYMAPEQAARLPATERSDQFSFCVCLYEGLYGNRPLVRGRRPLATPGAPSPRLESGSVPDRVFRILRRGLSPNPAARWPSMERLLQELEHAHTPRRSRRRLAMLAVAAGGAAAGGAALTIPSPPDACTTAREAFAEIWNDEVARRVRASSRFDASLDAYSEKWVTVHRQACGSDEAVSARARDAKMACLRRRSHDLSVLVDTLTRQGDTTAAAAVSAATSLPPIQACAHIGERDAPVTEEHPDIERRLAQARLLEVLGKYEEAEADARWARRESQLRGAPADEAAAYIQLASLHDRTGEYRLARDTLQHVYFDALQRGASHQALDAASALVLVVGLRLGDPEAARSWLVFAKAQAAKTNVSTRARAVLQARESQLLAVFGQHEESLRALERAIDLSGELPPPDPLRGELLAEKAAELGNLDRAGDALVALRASQMELTLRLGADHPIVAETVLGLGYILHSLDQEERARDETRRALATLERTVGPDGIKTVEAQALLGDIELSRGDDDAASEQFRRVLHSAGPGSVPWEMAVVGLARIEARAGKPEVAIARLEAARVEIQQRFGEAAQAHARVLFALANIEHELGRLDDARRHYEAARRIFAVGMGEDSSNVALVLHELGRVARLQNRWDDSRRLQERAVTITAAVIGEHSPRTSAMWSELAEVRLALGDDAGAAEAAQHARGSVP